MLNSMDKAGGVKESMVGSLPIGHPDYNAEWLLCTIYVFYTTSLSLV